MVRKLIHREVKELSQSHRVFTWQSLNSNQGSQKYSISKIIIISCTIIYAMSTLMSFFFLTALHNLWDLSLPAKD